MTARFFTAVSLLLSPALLAETAPAVPKALPSVDMAKSLAGLVAVLAVILALAWLLRRFGTFSRLAPGSFRVLAAVSLGSRERAVLLQAGGKQLVLGVAPGRVETLCVLENSEIIPVETGAPAAEANGSFAERLHELMGRRS
ncbi:flagellar biosynthetic protein FliO [Methylocaldum sp.]|uniref:flagellar biosynthetic protein FliO n=1 Tax=Methylocaldum sp. TaxID=1969727 RepID=UPI002D614EE3|nr:flagellar biosynthetic protein FliO [Methylocaldum sp.]HYE36789.1 flagellar biosynthetic protein FliO [Methylocaldum sp.]